MSSKNNSGKLNNLPVILILFGLAALLTAFLLLTNSKRSKAQNYERLTIDVFDSRANSQGVQSGWFGKLISDKFNIELNIIAPNVVGGGDTLFETRIAAENLGDLIIFPNSGDNLERLVDAGLLLDMTPFLNSDSVLYNYEAAIRNLNNTVSDNSIFALPTELSKKGYMDSCESIESTYGPFLRYDLYSALNYPVMESLEDMLTVLKDMQNLYPKTENGEKTYGFSFFPDWDNNMMTAAKQPACFYGYEEYGFLLYKVDGSDYQDIADRDSIYQQILHLYFEANRMGLLDPDSRNQNYTELFKKYENGQILYSPWPWLAKSAFNIEKNLSQEKGFMFVPIKNLQILSAGCKPGGNVDTVVAIGAGTKDPQRLVDFVNWLYSPEGIYANGARDDSGAPGPEGLTWENTEDGPRLTEFGINALFGSETPVPEEWGGGTWESGVSTLNVTTVTVADTAPNGYPYYYNLWDSVRDISASPLEKAWSEQMKASTTIDYLTKNNMLLVQPGYSFHTPSESQELSTIRSQCKRIITQYSWDMIYAENEERFYSIQAKMISTLKSLGYDTVVAFDLQNIQAQMAEALAGKIN